MKILVTGGSGFIGSHLLRKLSKKSFEVHATSRRLLDSGDGVTWHQTDLLDPGAGQSLVSQLKPQSILHLAWEAAPGQYLDSPRNQEWVRATEELLTALIEAGGQRFVGVGSMLEYGPKHEICDEDSTPALPTTPYGAGKLRAATLVVRAGEESSITSCWARIFHIYGPGEPRAKLVSHVASHILRGQRAPLTAGNQVRDFIYVEDVVSALEVLLHAEPCGLIDVGSGHGTSVKLVAELIGEILGRRDLLGFGDMPHRNQPGSRVIAATHRLRSLGWEPQVSLREGLELTIGALV